MAKKQKIQLYRTVTPGAAPSASNLSEGEIAINYHKGDETIFAKNDSAEIKKLSFDDKFIKDNFLNSTGTAENKTMSQKAITQNLEGKQVDAFDLSPYITIDTLINRLTISVKVLHEHMGNAKVCDAYVDTMRVYGQLALPLYGQITQTINKVGDSGNLIRIQFWLTIGITNGSGAIDNYEFSGAIQSLDSEPTYEELQSLELRQIPLVKNAKYLQQVKNTTLTEFNTGNVLPWRTIFIQASSNGQLLFPEYLDAIRHTSLFELWSGEYNVIIFNINSLPITITLAQDRERIFFIDNKNQITIGPGKFGEINMLANVVDPTNSKVKWLVRSTSVEE